MLKLRNNLTLQIRTTPTLTIIKTHLKTNFYSLKFKPDWHFFFNNLFSLLCCFIALFIWLCSTLVNDCGLEFFTHPWFLVVEKKSVRHMKDILCSRVQTLHLPFWFLILKVERIHLGSIALNGDTAGMCNTFLWTKAPFPLVPTYNIQRSARQASTNFTLTILISDL